MVANIWLFINPTLETCNQFNPFLAYATLLLVCNATLQAIPVSTLLWRWQLMGVVQSIGQLRSATQVEGGPRHLCCLLLNCQTPGTEPLLMPQQLLSNKACMDASKLTSVYHVTQQKVTWQLQTILLLMTKEVFTQQSQYWYRQDWHAIAAHSPAALQLQTLYQALISRLGHLQPHCWQRNIATSWRQQTATDGMVLVCSSTCTN